MLGRARRHREAELLVPVTRVEVEFLDLLRLRNPKESRRWNFTFRKLVRAFVSDAYRELVETARVAGFTTQWQVQAYLNVEGRPLVRPKLLFERLGAPDEGRTYRWAERP